MRLDFSVPETSLGKEWGKSTFCCCFCFFMELRNHTVRNHLHFTSCHLSVTEMEEPSPNPLLRLISLDWGVNQLPINFYQNLSRVSVLFASTDMAFSKHAQLRGAWYPLCSAAERGGKKHNSTQIIFGRCSILDLKGLTWLSIHQIPSIAF